MKSFRSSSSVPLWLRVLIVAAAALIIVVVHGVSARIADIEAGTPLEKAFFRLMPLPDGPVPFRRPPSETRPALTELIKAQPDNAELYSFRAAEDEQQLDFVAAEQDWKLYVAHVPDKVAAEFVLADFYHRRLRPQDEIQTLTGIANAPASAADKLTPASQQRSWTAFERIFNVIREQALSKDVAIAHYRAWLARYPGEQSLYARFLDFLISEKEFQQATRLIADYATRFPGDQIFPVKAKALLAYREGSAQQGLAVYEQSFQPLWSPELVKSYFDLLARTQQLRRFLDNARAAVAAHPEDLNATARIFYYYQQQGKLDLAGQAIADFRTRKESAKAQWNDNELFVCARLLDQIHAYPEAARYYYALYNTPGSKSQEQALSGLADILLSAPDAPIQFGSGSLAMYRDIATMDQGPGYLNGILSLLLNTTQPASKFAEEEQRANPYFHRSRASELLALLDTKFPNAAARADLHVRLLDYYAQAGESDAVIRGGRDFLTAFPRAAQRTAVALLMADAYARNGRSQEEFAIYDSVLRELGVQADQLPLGSGALTEQLPGRRSEPSESHEAQGDNAPEPTDESEPGVETPAPTQSLSEAFNLTAPSAEPPAGPRSPEYARVLERYLSRLVAARQIPQALAVLRKEIDRNPDDPGLYERLATFLDQNKLGAEQEEVYRRAIARFPEKSWYDRLARFYLRYKRRTDFERLTMEAVRTFDGTDLERYFQDVVSGGSAQLYLRLNQYANRRFPHNLVFVENLLSAYQRKETYDSRAWFALLSQHWFESSLLQNRYFEYLSRTGKLDSDLSALQTPQSADWETVAHENPAEASFVAAAEIWRSHFEAAAPVTLAVAEQYPADVERVSTASSLYRSLAYFDAAETAISAKLEANLSQADPTSTEILGRIGDIYADRDEFAKAAPYWNRIPQIAPGDSSGYLEAATIYWDYFDFDHAVRLLNEGRTKLHDDALFAYEEGAISENRRDYPEAVQQYLKGALAANSDSRSESRLLTLASRPKLAKLIDKASAKAVGGANPSLPAINLRVKILDTQNRKAELATFLESVLSSTTSIEQASAIENLAQQHSLESVRQHALEKQAALTADPVTRLQLRYALVHSYEQNKDFPAAQRTVEVLYQENPRLLGVVRSTVDFYWRAKMYPQAVSVLLQAAAAAYPALSNQFSLEAARKSIDSGQYPQAREIIAKLLKDSPYDAQYVAAMADSYVQANDDPGLRQFYLNEIAELRNAPLSSDERKNRIASIRRALIPALTRLKNYSEAVDQYIELINNFPEDEGLVTEAALYAQRYQQQSKLIDFYAKTVAQSPRDYRWSMVLARVQTSLENFPEAIETYGKAITIRPDRVDLRIARAGLEERLFELDQAAADYEKIYQLAYKDPQWMQRLAEIRARQGRTSDAVTALKAALIDGRPESAAKHFDAARRLESWNMLAEAEKFSEQGMAVAGNELLATSDNHSGAQLYARIMTRLRLQDKAYTRLQQALSDASAAMPVVEQQLARQGIAGVTDQEYRDRLRESREQTARQGLSAALTEMGATVANYFTPEEKLAFARFAETKRGPMSAGDVESFAIPLGQAAGLADLEARWRYELISTGTDPSTLLGRMQSLIQLQRSRLKLSELGQQLESIVRRFPPEQRHSAQLAAADAYRSAGDQANELRMLSTVSVNDMSVPERQRYFQLLLARAPQKLVQQAAVSNANGEAAADYVVANAEAQLAHDVVNARGTKRPPVWSKAYTSLVGLYFAENSPTVNSAFLGALGDETIAQRLGHPVDRSQQLAGNIWFYYGSRYGEYLALAKSGGAEDFLPAELEQSPATPDGYINLADYYADSHDPARAIADYQHAIELAPDRADVHDRLALAYYNQRSPEQAVAQWKQALAVLRKQAESARVPETFWADFGRVCDHIAARHLFNEVRADVDSLIRFYLRRNGNYRSNALLHSVYAAVADPAAATAWIIDLASAAHDPVVVLSDIADARWIPLPNRAPIYQRILQARADAVAKAAGLEKDYAEQDLRAWQVRWIRYLVTAGQYAQAEDAINALPKETRLTEAATLVPLQLRADADLGKIDSRVGQYKSEPQSAPSSDILRSAAHDLSDTGDKASARKILEFDFARDIENHQLVPANFLGLAEIRIASGDVPGAVELLRRLTLVVGNPYENLDPAAALLENTGHNAEALEFLDALVKSAPWIPSYQLRLAKAQVAAHSSIAQAQQELQRLGSSHEVAYAVRVQAAIALAPSSADLGSRELGLLAAGSVPAVTAADEPYFYDARLKSAQALTDSVVKVKLLVNVLADTPTRPDARLPLFNALANLHSDELALATIEPLLGQHLLAPAVTSQSEESLTAEEQEPESPVQNSTWKLAPAEQARTARTLADIMVRLQRPAEAVTYLQVARKTEKNPSISKQLSATLSDLRAQLRRQQLNASRRPVLHDALEQDRIVRPRLLARAASSPTAKGVQR